MVQVLAPDAEFEAAGSETIHGRDAVLRYLGGLQPSGATPPSGRYVPAGGRPSLRHFTSTVQIDLLSERQARVRSYYQVVTATGLDHWGRYLDDFGVVDGEWLITRRVITTEGRDPDGWAAGLDAGAGT
jgi:hypothetical protein